MHRPARRRCSLWPGVLRSLHCGTAHTLHERDGSKAARSVRVYTSDRLKKRDRDREHTANARIIYAKFIHVCAGARVARSAHRGEMQNAKCRGWAQPIGKAPRLSVISRKLLNVLFSSGVIGDRLFSRRPAPSARILSLLGGVFFRPGACGSLWSLFGQLFRRDARAAAAVSGFMILARGCSQGWVSFFVRRGFFLALWSCAAGRLCGGEKFGNRICRGCTGALGSLFFFSRCRSLLFRGAGIKGG